MSQKATSTPRTAQSATKRTRKAWGDKVLSVEERREQREALLFETAARLFNQYGYHGTSISLLTQELGLTKGAVYYYVKDKQDLLYQLHMKSAEATRRSYERAVAEGRNGHERLQLAVKYYVEAVTNSPTETFIRVEAGALDPDKARDIAERRKTLEIGLRSQIEEGIADGSIVPCDPKLASLAVVGAMAWVSRWYVKGGDWSPDQVAASMSEMLGRMVSATPSAALTRNISGN